MAEVLSGIRVLEVAIYGFVPSAGAVLAEWGADVVKVEHPESGDPMRGSAYNGVIPGARRSAVLYEVFNRGKRSVGLDLRTEGGRELLMRLVDRADVFTTNFTATARRKLGIDAEQITARNPCIVYARGTGQGTKGPDADQGGFDTMTYWSRSGAGRGGMSAGSNHPGNLPAAGFGDIQSGHMLAGGICAALLRRERTGQGAVVDISLLATGMWAMQSSITGAYVAGTEDMPMIDPERPPNVLVNMYRTSDDRYVTLQMLEADRYWAQLCKTIGYEQLVTDERFLTAELREQNLVACTRELAAIFARHDLAHWRDLLARQEGQWGVVQTAREALNDPQAIANGYIQWISVDDEPPLPVVAAPVQFDGDQVQLQAAPEHAAHTDEVLLECGLSWDDLIQHKISGAIS